MAQLCATCCACALFCVCASPNISFAQGSIFGAVSNADLSTPPNGTISLVGFINDSDAEIRTDISIGAGFDNGNWFDDFQNYLSESAGQPYDYFFYNAGNSEGAHLSNLIPGNSFQQEDVTLTPVSWPSQPTGLTVTEETPGAVSLRWDYDPTLTYHVYRRPTTSAGSFFRIDDPSGALTNPGVADSVFTDTAIDGATTFDYLIIAENGSGVFSRHSELSLRQTLGCCQLAGDINRDGRRNIGDALYIISYMFSGGPAPVCREQADVNNDSKVNIADVTYYVTWVFQGGPAPLCGSAGLAGSIKSFDGNNSFTGSS